jgi:hypothetical protein
MYASLWQDRATLVETLFKNGFLFDTLLYFAYRRNGLFPHIAFPAQEIRIIVVSE